VIIFDGDFVRMPCLPSESDAAFLVDAEAVPSCFVASEQLQPVSRGDAEVLQSDGEIDGLQLAPRRRPKLPGESPSLTAVPLPKQVCRRLIRERLNHDGYMIPV
jgi:hypothetical protein